MPQDNKKQSKQQQQPQFSWDQVVSLINGLGQSTNIDRSSMRAAYTGSPDAPSPYYTPRMSTPSDAAMYFDSPVMLRDKMLQMGWDTPPPPMPQSAISPNSGQGYDETTDSRDYKMLMGPSYSYGNVEMPIPDLRAASEKALEQSLPPSARGLFKGITPIGGFPTEDEQRQMMRLAAMQKLGALERAGRPQYLRPEDQGY